MATADRLENVGTGIKGIKEHMKDMATRIRETNARANRLESENDQVKQIYIKSFGRQQALKDRFIMVEEKLERNTMKMKDLTKRVEEKERFMEESLKFNRSLKVTVPDEGEVADMEDKLKIQREVYSKNYERYQTARNKKVELEQDFEHIELKAHEAMRRVETLKTELENNQIEEGRRSEGCKTAIDAAFKCEKTCMDLQHGLDIIMKRKSEANQKINKLEKEVTKAENATDTLKYERQCMEATIRECLINIKSQRQ